MVEMQFGDDDDLRAMLEVEQKLVNYGNTLSQELDAALDYLADKIKEVLETTTWQLWPHGSGLTASSWTVIPLGMGDFYITNSNEPTITYLTEGTAAHWIQPVSAKALRWYDEYTGQIHFSMGHQVRGIVGMDVEAIVMTTMDTYIDQVLDSCIDAADREFGFE